MSGAQLKPCPFCGAELDYAEPVTYVHPIGKCILSGRNFKAGYIGQWNRRTPDPAQIRADALRAAGREYILEHVMETDWHRQGRHSAIRGMMVRMGLYAELEAAIDEAIAESATPLSPTAVDGSPAPDAGGNDDPAVYLIRKYGGYYRPNCQGYTRFKEEAGRYTLAKAIRESHPNGPDGPRDGMTYIHEDNVLPFDAGGKEGV